MGGYLAALLVAVGIIWLYIEATSGLDRGLLGMYWFGDLLLFIAIFGAVSIVPTGLTLVFLRQSRGFWNACAIVALLVAGTALAEVVLDLLERQVLLGSGLSM